MEFLNNDEQEILWQYRAAQACPTPVTTLSPLSTQIPLSHPSARRACTPSSVASPLAPATSLPIERLAQRHATKQHRSIIESGTEDSGAEGTYGGAESTYSSAELENPVDPVLQNLTSMYEASAQWQGKSRSCKSGGIRRRSRLFDLVPRKSRFSDHL